VLSFAPLLSMGPNVMNWVPTDEQIILFIKPQISTTYPSESHIYPEVHELSFAPPLSLSLDHGPLFSIAFPQTYRQYCSFPLRPIYPEVQGVSCAPYLSRDKGPYCCVLHSHRQTDNTVIDLNSFKSF
jgi:hypothetical protein